MKSDIKELMDNFSAFVDLSLRAADSTAINSAFRFPTSLFLIEKLGFPNIDIYITEKTIKKIINFHGVSVSFIKNLPVLLDNKNEEYISSIFKSHTQENSRVIVSFEFVGNQPIIVAIALNKQVNSNDFVNNIASVYEKRDGFESFKRWENKALLLYKNNSKKLTLPKKRIIIKHRKIRT